MNRSTSWTVVKTTELPAATWYDETQQHFVALLERSNDSESNHNKRGFRSELVQYQILRFCSSDDGLQPTLYSLRLPLSLANADESTNITQRRIPLLTKFSLDQTLVAIQYSKSLVRIAPVHPESSSQEKHWTLDLSTGNWTPQSSSCHAVPKAHYSYSTANNSNTQQQQQPLEILPGGLLWSDHGGNSQDLVLVTQTQVLCYKISLRRNHMASTYTFAHAVASAFWWAPTSRTLMVGSYNGDDEPLQLRPFALYSKKEHPRRRKRHLQLPRLELPPPERYPVATSSTTRIAPAQVALVNLYNHPYVVQVVEEEGGLQIQILELSHELGVVLYKKFNVSMEGDAFQHVNFESMIVTVLDNVLCVCLRDAQVGVFVDIAVPTDGGGFAQVVSLDASICDPSLSFIPPSFLLNPEGNGMVQTLELDMKCFFSSLAVETKRTTLSFFLRRSSLQVPDICLNLLSTVLELESTRERTTWLDEVAKAYATKCPAALSLDFESTLHLIFPAACLPPGAEFWFRPAVSSTPTRRSVTQKDILETILIPSTRRALDTNNRALLQRICNVAVELIGALERQGLLPCPALECLAVSTLWRLGCAEEVLAFLRSRSLRNCHDNKDPMGSRQTRHLGTELFARVLAGIATHPGVDEECGGLSKKALEFQRSRLLEESLSILSSGDSDPASLVEVLLSRGRLADAMAVCQRILLSGDSPEEGATLLSQPKRRRNRGEEFFYAALLQALECSNVLERGHVLYSTHAFLMKWDPDCLSRRYDEEIPTTSRGTTQRDDSNELLWLPASRVRRRIQQRSSFVALDAVEMAGRVPGHSLIARQFPQALDLLFGSNRELQQKLKRLFGYNDQ